jgi:K+-transporting ATPase ATPase C chain
MFTDIIRSTTAILALTALLGLGYPLLITGIAQLATPDTANGSLVSRDGDVVGSTKVAQAFESDEYFHPRPSAATYDGASSVGSNLGPNNQQLSTDIADRARAYSEREAVELKDVPVDMVTASASGLDPHISPDAALQQVERVADSRDLDDAAVQRLVRDHTETPTFGFLGAKRVNVLELNLALDRLT